MTLHEWLLLSSYCSPWSSLYSSHCTGLLWSFDRAEFIPASWPLHRLHRLVAGFFHPSGLSLNAASPKRPSFSTAQPERASQAPLTCNRDYFYHIPYCYLRLCIYFFIHTECEFCGRGSGFLSTLLASVCLPVHSTQ